MSFNFNIIDIVFWILIWLTIWYLLAKIYFWINIRKERKNAIWKSKSVILWHVNEKIAPILPDFPYNYKDMVFIWKWIDYIIFDWLSEWNLNKVVFLEIKSGKSNLNKNEKSVKNTVNEKKVFYEIMRIKN